MNIHPFQHRIDSVASGAASRNEAANNVRKSNSSATPAGESVEEIPVLDPLPRDLEPLAIRIREFPKVREEKVNEVVKRLEAGEYDSADSVEEVADAFLRSLNEENLS